MRNEKLEIISGQQFLGYSYEDVAEFFGFVDGKDFYTEQKAVFGVGSQHPAFATEVLKYPDYRKLIYMGEEPNGFGAASAYNGIQQVESAYDLLLTTCKYTMRWREIYFGINNRIYVPTPWSEKFMYPDQEKTVPVYFTGHTRPAKLLDIIYRLVPKYNGKIVDGASYGVISHDEKMKENGKAKISITYGLLFLLNHHVASIKSIPHWNGCEAFLHIDEGLMPQMKTRVYEAALSKSIILHQWDEWNIIEDWYIPNEDFIYFDGEKDLEEKINEILKNYEGYKYIAENAYNKTINNYMVDHFVEKYILPNTKLEV